MRECILLETEQILEDLSLTSLCDLYQREVFLDIWSGKVKLVVYAGALEVSGFESLTLPNSQEDGTINHVTVLVMHKNHDAVVNDLGWCSLLKKGIPNARALFDVGLADAPALACDYETGTGLKNHVGEWPNFTLADYLEARGHGPTRSLETTRGLLDCEYTVVYGCVWQEDLSTIKAFEKAGYTTWAEVPSFVLLDRSLTTVLAAHPISQGVSSGYIGGLLKLGRKRAEFAEFDKRRGHVSDSTPGSPGSNLDARSALFLNSAAYPDPKTMFACKLPC